MKIERSAFNRGMLINIGFKEVQQLGEQFPCVILHDVDMLPEDDGNSYTCAEEGKPRQMAYSIDYAANYKYKLFNILDTEIKRSFIIYLILSVAMKQANTLEVFRRSNRVRGYGFPAD